MKNRIKCQTAWKRFKCTQTGQKFTVPGVTYAYVKSVLNLYALSLCARIMFLGWPFVNAFVRPLVRCLTNQWTEFQQILIDDVVDIVQMR